MSFGTETLVEVMRGGRIESEHRGAIAVVDASGKLIARVGDVNLTTYLRSSAKPFQLLPLVESGALTLHAGVQNDRTPSIYNAHAIYVNLTPSGSFDKTIGEAMASGCVVVAGNEAMRGVTPDDLIVDPLSADSVAAGIEKALAFSAEQRTAFAESLREYVVREHSLVLLTRKLTAILHN